mmetsp:Transcript_9448/g.30005  ORF Transcript_9448/g.30005 Transcript_9448/m.30005 type:complete len:220 (-) Transcript_9448:102-761(-)
MEDGAAHGEERLQVTRVAARRRPGQVEHIAKLAKVFVANVQILAALGRYHAVGNQVGEQAVRLPPTDGHSGCEALTRPLHQADVRQVFGASLRLHHQRLVASVVKAVGVARKGVAAPQRLWCPLPKGARRARLDHGVNLLLPRRHVAKVHVGHADGRRCLPRPGRGDCEHGDEGRNVATPPQLGRHVQVHHGRREERCRRNGIDDLQHENVRHGAVGVA